MAVPNVCNCGVPLFAMHERWCATQPGGASRAKLLEFHGAVRSGKGSICPAKCGECKGRGSIPMLVTVRICTVCGGAGVIYLS